MFTKLNIVDKFGQAIAVIDPRPHIRVTSTVTPCLSDTYYPGAIGDADPSLATSRANTVLAQSANSACPFIQLPPAINQPARVNGGFVLKVDGKWKLASEWEVCTICSANIRSLYADT